MGFENLSDVHTRWNAQRVENDVDRCTIGQERHVFLRKDPRDNTLVSVTSGHFVAWLQLTLNGDEHLDHLEHARCEFITALQLLTTIFELLNDQLDGIVILNLDRFKVTLDLVIGNRDFPPFVTLDFAEIILSDLVALLDALWRCGCSLTNEHVFQAVVGRTVQNRTFVLAILRKTLDFFAFDGHRTLVLVDAVAVKHAHFNNSTSYTR